jgi:hypothetical protein
MIVSYNASAVKIYNATNSLPFYIIKIIFPYFKTLYPTATPILFLQIVNFVNWLLDPILRLRVTTPAL